MSGAGRGSHQHGGARHPTCKLTVFISQDVAAPLARRYPGTTAGDASAAISGRNRREKSSPARPVVT
jgi:hypothetical protein